MNNLDDLFNELVEIQQNTLTCCQHLGQLAKHPDFKSENFNYIRELLSQILIAITNVGAKLEQHLEQQEWISDEKR